MKYNVTLEQVQDSIWRIVGTDKILLLTKEQEDCISRTSLAEGITTERELFDIANAAGEVVYRLLAERLQSATAPPMPGGLVTPLPAATKAPTGLAGAFTGTLPATQPSPAPAPAPIDESFVGKADIGGKRSGKQEDIDSEIESLGLASRTDFKHLPFRVNNDAGEDGSYLSEKKLSRYLSVYESSSRDVQINVIIKLAGAQMQTLLRLRSLIPKKIKEQIGSVILQRDGSKTNFIPAEIDLFVNDVDTDISPLGIKISSTEGHIPEDFEETSIMSLEVPKYIDSGTTLKRKE